MIEQTTAPTIRVPNAPATKRQTFYIFRLGGGDVRGENLTMQQAATRIEQLLEAKGAPAAKVSKVTVRSSVVTKTPVAKVKAKKASRSNYHPFAVALEEANEAANRAGDAWVKQATPIWEIVDFHGKKYKPMLDVCGIVHLVIEDGRTAFAKWYSKTYPYRSPHRNKNDKSNTLIILRHKYVARQELGLRQACEGAAREVLLAHGCKSVHMNSRID